MAGGFLVGRWRQGRPTARATRGRPRLPEGAVEAYRRRLPAAAPRAWLRWGLDGCSTGLRRLAGAAGGRGEHSVA